MKVGKISESVLKRSVLKQIKTKRNEIVNGAGVGEDCAVFMLPEGCALASCVQEAELARPGKDPAGSMVSAGRAGAAQDGSAGFTDGAGAAQDGSAGFAGRAGAAQDGSAGFTDGAGAAQDGSAGFAGSAGAEDTGVGRLIVKAANNLAAAGAEPIGVGLALFLSEDWEEPDLRRLMQEAEEVCRRMGMQLAGGHTSVYAGIPSAFAAATGYGRTEKGWSPGKALPGQDIVISKWIGLEGTSMLARAFGGKLRGRYPGYLVDEAAGFDRFLSIAPEAATAVKSGVRAMHDASGGGIFAALWELAERSGTGLSIDLKKLPIRQETVEVCECCEVNPYELLSGGCLVMASDDGEALAAELEAGGIPAAVAGRITEGRDRIVKNGEDTRYLERPRADEICRMK